MKHTPEPWGVNPERLCEVRQCDENDVPRLQLVADTSTVNARVPWRENARRIVACVNACEGIPTSRLEAGAADILAYSMELKRQRDELLADEVRRLREENAGLNRSLGERWSVIEELRKENRLLEKVRDALAKKLNEIVLLLQDDTDAA